MIARGTTHTLLSWFPDPHILKTGNQHRIIRLSSISGSSLSAGAYMSFQWTISPLYKVLRSELRSTNLVKISPLSHLKIYKMSSLVRGVSCEIVQQQKWHLVRSWMMICSKSTWTEKANPNSELDYSWVLYERLDPSRSWGKFQELPLLTLTWESVSWHMEAWPDQRSEYLNTSVWLVNTTSRASFSELPGCPATPFSSRQ